MGYIKEPKGVDFTIQSTPLSDEGRKAISEYIQKYKAQKKVVKSAKVVVKDNADSKKETA